MTSVMLALFLFTIATQDGSGSMESLTAERAKVSTPQQEPEFKALLRKAAKLASAEKNEYFRSHVLIEIVGLQSRTENVDDALENLKAIVPKYQRILALAEAATARAEAGDNAGGHALLDRANELVTFDDVDILMDSGRTHLAIAYGRCGDVDRSIRLLEKCGDDMDRERAAVTFAKASAAKGDIEQALQVFKKIRIKDQDWFLVVVARDRVHAGDAKGAFSIGKAIGTPSLQGEVYKDVAELEAKLGQWEAAFQAAAAGQDPASRAQSLTAIGHVQATKGNRAGAVDTLGKAANECAGIKDAHERANVLADLIRGWAAAGQEDKVRKTAGMIESTAAELNAENPIKSRVPVIIVGAFGRLGKLEDARGRLKLLDAGLHDSAWYQLASALNETGPLEEALKTAEAILDPGAREACLIGIAKTRLEQNDRVGALRSLKAAFEITKTRGPNTQLASVVEVGFEKGRPYEVARLFAKLGDIKGALQVARVVEKDEESHTAISEIVQEVARTHAESAPLSEVLKWIRKEPSELVRAHAIVGALQAKTLKK